MTSFLLDLLHDLREKRLLPVAAVLLLALVAVPVVLSSSGGGEPTESKATNAGAGAGGAGQPLVAAVDQGAGGPSDLGVFDPKDPFKPAGGARRGGAGAGSQADGTATLVKPFAGGTATGTSAATPATPTPPGGSSGGSTGGSAGGGSAPSAPSGPVIRRVRRDYTYVIDVKFGQTGNERTRRGVKRLGILPNDRNPVVVFLGVSADVKRAVFLIDSRVSQSGEGACRPSVKSCTFLYLRDAEDRNEQFLTDDQGREYHLTLLDIRRVEVKRSAKKARAKASRRKIGPRAKATRFPLLAPDVQR